MAALGRHACVGVGAVYSNDLERDIYCLLGVPVDAINMASALHAIDAAAGKRSAFFISTPNLNFLVQSRAALNV